jgi:DNA-binding transcriptional regulator YhcF (GntR family)
MIKDQIWYELIPVFTVATIAVKRQEQNPIEVRSIMKDVDLEGSFKIVGVKRRRLHESVAEQIRQAIFRGSIRAGHKLPPEREMAEHFQTSRVTLKEALRALEKEGLIMIRRGGGGGAFVADFDNALNALADLLNTVVKLGSVKSANLTEMRSTFEPEITRLATLRATPEDISAIDAVLIAQWKGLESGELSRKLDQTLCVQGAEQGAPCVEPDTLLLPLPQTPPAGRRGRKLIRQKSPRRPGLQHPQDAFKARPVRCPWSASVVLSAQRFWKQWLDQLPLCVAQQLLPLLHDRSSTTNPPHT